MGMSQSVKLPAAVKLSAFRKGLARLFLHDRSSLIPTDQRSFGLKTKKTFMKLWLTCALCLALSALLGACGKSETDPDLQPAMEVEGVKVDFPALQASVLKASPEIQSAVSEAATKVRYKRYIDALTQVDETLKQPGLNDKQKKLMARVFEQLKEVLQKPGVQSN
jgi:hypothetical protein